MSFVTLVCPDCGRHTVFNGRGRCQCGTFLVDHWEGMAHYPLYLPYDGRVYIRENGEYRLIRETRVPVSDSLDDLARHVRPIPPKAEEER